MLALASRCVLEPACGDTSLKNLLLGGCTPSDPRSESTESKRGSEGAAPLVWNVDFEENRGKVPPEGQGTLVEWIFGKGLAKKKREGFLQVMRANRAMMEQAWDAWSSKVKALDATAYSASRLADLQRAFRQVFG